MRRWALPMAGVIFLIAGSLFRPIAADPDAVFSNYQVFGTFLIFLFFALGIYSLGRIFSLKLLGIEPGAALSFAFGTAIASLLFAVAGALGAVGYSAKPAYILFLLGCMSISVLMDIPARVPRATDLKLSWPMMAVLGYVLVVMALRAALLHGQSDPPLYHLLGPRLWTDRGKIEFVPWLPWAYQAASWEYLYGWGSILLGEIGGRGVIEQQFFAQWIHALIGLVGAAATFGLLIRRFFPKVSQILVAIAILAALAAGDLVSAGWLSKNDWGVIFWVLAGCLTLEIEPKDPKKKLWSLILASLLFASAISTKPTMVIPCLAFVLMLNRLPWRNVVLLGSGILLFWLPLLLRNDFATGNPFFPYLANRFPSTRITEFLQKDLAMLSATKLNSVSGFLMESGIIFRESYIFWFLPLAVVAIVLLIRRRHLDDAQKLLRFCVAGGICVLWYPMLHFSEGYVRWVGAGFLFLGAIPVVALGLIRVPMRGVEALAGIAVFALTFHLFNPIPSMKEFLQGHPPNEVLRSSVHIGGSAKAWLRLNLKPGERAATTGDNQLYYVQHLGVFALMENPETYTELIKRKDTREVVDYLYEQNFTYLLDSRHWSSNAWGGLAAGIHRMLQGRTEAIVFESPDAIVIDVKRLHDLIRSSRNGEQKPDLWREQS